jgi:hypothetical protein
MPTELHLDMVLHRVLARDVDHADRHAHHALGMVGHLHRHAAHRHVGVAHRLDLLDAELVGGVVEAGEQAVQQETTSAGGMSDDMAVKPTMSAKATVTSAKPSAMPCSPPRRRLAIGAGRTFSSSSSFSRFLLSMTTFFSLMLVDHAVEGETKLADLVARAHRHVGRGVARREAPHAGGELAQWPQERARQPGAGHDHDQKGDRAHDHEVALELADRGKGFRRSRSWRSAPI